MTERVRKILSLIKSREHKKIRSTEKRDISDLVRGLSRREADLVRLKETLMREVPVFHGEEDIFGFNRTVANTMTYAYTGSEEGRHLLPGNITPDYSRLIDFGFDSVRELISEKLPLSNVEQRSFYITVTEYLDTVEEFCERYRQKAKEEGRDELYTALSHVPAKGARTLYEAYLFQKILIFILRHLDHQHMTLGRFDIYMYKYYKADIERGISHDELFELTELYFIALNTDSDIYRGVQQGDNGQSMVLGGFDADGNYAYNELSDACMHASLELELIDPKINLRVGKNTPKELFELGTSLTKKGLGFPQYCNDDVVVPGLISLGYDREDALNYTVAACWEYIIPGKSMDVPNNSTFDFPSVINRAISERLSECDDFDSLLSYVDSYITDEAKRIMSVCRGRESFHFGHRIRSAPFLSLLIEGCLEKGKDISELDVKYKNLGCHGAGIANAADALAAVKKVIYDEKSVKKEQLLRALDENFEGHAPLRNLLLSCPKVGNADAYADDLMIFIMDVFSHELNGKPNGAGGIWRAGTGSAMEYILTARKCPATADGRLSGAPYGSSFSPSLTTKLNGPLSVIRSFTRPDMKKTINGGPLTMEVHDTVFRNSEGESKVASLVRLFIELGGHQLQLNAVNRERLRDAQIHPENYPNLVVRVWGWSGYFCELDREYQDHIISRTEFSV